MTNNRVRRPGGDGFLRRLDVGYLLRRVAGVEEDILRRVPSEIPRYSALGGLILGTALTAALSMGLALRYTINWPTPASIGVALLWGLMVLNLDRWLGSIGSPPGPRQAAPRLLGRLLLALLLGVVTAEALLLGVFQTAVEERVVQNRQEAVLHLESELRSCNELTQIAGAGKTDNPSCSGRRLAAVEPMRVTQDQLLRLEREATSTGQEIDRILATVASLHERAAAECSGGTGNSAAGSPGAGPRCRLLTNEANRYAADRDLAGKQNRMRELNARITETQQRLDAEAAITAARLETDIRTQVDRARSRQQGIGLLERFDALGELSSESSQVYIAGWTLRLLFVIIQMMPVLSRMLGGTTSYDRLVRLREKAAVDQWVSANIHVTHDLFDLLQSQQRELMREIPVRAGRGDE